MSIGSGETHRSGSEERYLRLKEAAARMSVTYKWLYLRIARDEGPPGVKRRGRIILIPEIPFLEWSKQDIIP